MAMTLGITIPPTPSAGNSPISSDNSSNPPRTPGSSPDMQTVSLSDHAHNTLTHSTNGHQMKRKPSRRANTAERRATHNAVERQRRETLNGRFLDLAGLLPNLSQIRRPSKSSIVNSSIAHIHASRRHRLLAARELRLLKLESDALRRELNEWRDRAAVPRVEEPVRGEGFSRVMSGEIEVLAAVAEEEDENEGVTGAAAGYDGFYEDGEEELVQGSVEENERQQASAIASILNGTTNNGTTTATTANTNAATNPYTTNIAQIIPRAPQTGPIIATSPTAVSFENPAMASLYDQGFAGGTPYIQQQAQQPQLTQQDIEKWNYAQQQQRSLFTPGIGGGGGGVGPTLSDQVFFANLQRSQQQGMNGAGGGVGGAGGHVYGSPEMDDVSSVGSGSGRDSGYGTPPLSGGGGAGYEVAAGGDYGVRRMSHGGYDVGMGMGMMKQSLSPSAIGGHAGGGGSAGGFAMMMM